MYAGNRLPEAGRKMTTIESFYTNPPRHVQNPEALASQDFQTALIGMIGHDLRQSVQIIKSTYTLLKPRLNAAPHRAWIDRGEWAVENLTDLFDRLVDVFYLAECASTPEVAPVALAPMFRRLQNENKGFSVRRGVDLRMLTTRAEVISNPLLLEGVLRNLMTNAIKYTGPGGRVLVGCRRVKQDIRIDVYDTGIGIPEDQLSQIFDAYTRLAPEYNEGLGIGLFIVRRALAALGHRIEVRSIVGKGSLFSVYLPSVSAVRSN
jgi:two-component system, OmpR family, phosphate regulon sensor histidine kinase PhoR